MKQAFVGIGSNLDQPLMQVQSALLSLANLPSTTLVAHSSCYQTIPIDCPDNSPSFINAVAKLNTTLEPLALLVQLLQIELSAKRIRSIRNAPRSLDCDLLLYEGVHCTSTELTLPHPRMHQRGFVLIPLHEICPDISLVPYGKVADLIRPEWWDKVVRLN